MGPRSAWVGLWVLAVAALLSACGGSRGVTVTVTPATASVPSGTTRAFTAGVVGAGDASVTWQSDCGALAVADASATLTAAGVPRSCAVTARSVADPQRSASATVTVTADVDPGVTQGSDAIASPGLEDEVLAVAVGPDGVVAFGGATRGALTALPAVGEADAFVVLQEADGGERWRVQFGDPGEDAVTGLAVRGDGVVVAVGFFTAVPGGQPSAYAFGLDGETGSTLWKAPIATPERDVAVAVVVDDEGRAYVAGDTRGALAPFANAGFSDVFVVRVDPDGAIDGVVQFGGPGFEQATDLVLLPGGDVVLVGEAGDVVPGTGPAYLGSVFAVRFGAGLGATPAWVTQAGGDVDVRLRSLAVDPQGDLVAAGDAAGPVGDEPHQGDLDLVLARIAAADGALTFVRQVGTADAEFGHALAVDDAGRAWVGGNVLVLTGGDASEAVLHVFGPDDALLLRETLPVGAHGGVNAIALAAPREALLGGWSAAAAPGDRSGWDGFLLRRGH